MASQHDRHHFWGSHLRRRHAGTAVPCQHARAVSSQDSASASANANAEGGSGRATFSADQQAAAWAVIGLVPHMAAVAQSLAASTRWTQRIRALESMCSLYARCT
jgi:hypothetical protein